jgi:hypothetical protein
MDYVLAAATIVLVLVTGYYAYQTRLTVNELRNQRIVATEHAANGERRRRQRLQDAVRDELEQVLAMIEGKQGTGRNFMRLPMRAWEATFGEPDLLEAHRKKLFEVYAEVERMNALITIMTSNRSGPGGFDSGGIGLDRHTSSDFLAREIKAILSAMASETPQSETRSAA